VATLFIADLHLQTEEPAITAGFLRFLQGEARQADALYILGDLFEAWIGDDDPNPLHQQIAAAIKAVVDAGVPCYFIHGNRDFLVGQRFARQSGMILLAEEERLDLYGREVLIMHGDTLCTDDQAIWRFAPKSTPRGSSVCSWPCRCLSAAASPPACAPTAKPPTAVNQWTLWM
jgi:UDP-2,3-diacylglucosamine hydrolase